MDRFAAWLEPLYFQYGCGVLAAAMPLQKRPPALPKWTAVLYGTEARPRVKAVLPQHYPALVTINE